MMGHLHTHWVCQFCSQSPLARMPYEGCAYPELRLHTFFTGALQKLGMGING